MLQIDMIEEPEDENDRIFLATNQLVGDEYKLVIPYEHVDVAAAVAAVSQSIVNIGQQLANALGSTLGTVMQAIRDMDEQQMRATHPGLEQFDIQAYDANARLHKQEV